MIDSFLKKENVSTFIDDIKTNENIYNKDKNLSMNYPFEVSNELALYTFYEALFKYKVVLDDEYLFDEYLENLEKIFKKIDNYEDIVMGINKLIGKMVSIKLGIKNLEDKSSRKEIITYIYNKYIVDGYYIHGFNTSYCNQIKDNGFNPEDYENYYEEFKKLNKIFAKYNAINIIGKDFNDKKVFFTDDLITACYYSNFSPLFYYEFLSNKEYFGKRIRKNDFLKDDYSIWTKHIKKFISDSFVSDSDKKFINELVQKQWDLLHREEKKISLLVVKRKKISDEIIKLDEYLNDDSELEDVIDRLLSSKYSNVYCDKAIAKEDCEIINLDIYEEINVEDNVVDLNKEYYKLKEEAISADFMNMYGKASIFMILGALFISLGVIFTIIMILRGI